MSAARDIRLVISDVDGTLITPDGSLTEAVIAAVRALRAAGIAFTVTSSRPPRGLAMLIEPLGIEGLIAGFNGGALVRPDLSAVETHAIGSATAEAALRLMRDRGVDVWLYTEDRWLVRDAAAPHVAKEQGTVRFAPEVVAEFSAAALAGAIKLVGVSDDLARVAAVGAHLGERLGDAASVASSHPYYVEVTSARANKGAVVSRLGALLGVPTAAIATIGDGENDVAMFHSSGFSIAMGNATDAVKAAATEVTESNQRDGFAVAMRRFVLPETRGTAV